ncbi:MAG: AAA family ATPase [Pseudomonadales bacterium]|nr:AAA family ATPase [Pseudomonadales bacterium]
MPSKSQKPFQRAQAATVAARLAEPRRFMQVVAGPRQVGKTTLVQQVIETLPVPVHQASADEPGLRSPQWLAQQWEAARLAIDGVAGAVLVLDESKRSINPI